MNSPYPYSNGSGNGSGNGFNATPSSSGYDANGDDEIDLRELFYTLWDHRILIAIVTASVTALGLAYAVLATPIYESNILVQVEDSSGGSLGKSMLGDASAMFDVKTDAAAEMEILKSRMIASKPVDELGLNIDAEPRYFPLIGHGIASLRDELGTPGLFGMGGWAWGADRIQIGQLHLPHSRIGKVFTLTALGAGAYELQDPLSAQRFKGQVGQVLPLAFNDSPTGAHAILVRELLGNAGTQYRISASSRLAQIKSLQTQLAIKEQGKGSGVISVGLQGDNPQLVAKILNSVGHEYLRQNIERKSQEAENSLQFLGKQLPQLKQELESAETQYNQYRNKSGTTDLDEEAKTLLQQASQAQTRLAEVKQKQVEMAARYLPEHPNMQALAGMQAQAQIELERVNTAIRRLPLVEQDALRLARDMKVSTDLYTNLLQSVQQLRLVKAGKVGTVRLIDEAYLPERPVAPKKSLILAISVLLGFVLGVALVLMRKALRGAIESVEQVEQLTGLPVFASVPHSTQQVDIASDLGKRKKTQLLAQSHPNEPSVESLRSFNTAMQFATLGARNNIVLITGPAPEVGKSFISANYAAVLAASGKRVLLIDADIRKGYLHKYFGLEQGKGLSELLLGKLSLDLALHSAILPNLDFISCGVYPPNPVELLRHPNTQALLEKLSAAYDLVLIDAAPVLPVTDPLILASHAGSTIVVVREGLSTREEVQEAQKKLQQSGIAVTGLLFNDLQANKSKYKYGYKYAYQYRYGGTAAAKPKSAWAKWFK
jgi:tyrosine-protein kinase Etk/Wzc